MKSTGIVVETSVADAGEEIHIYPRESRRGKAQWAIYVREDGSGFMFIDSEQVHLPANGDKSSTRGKTLQRVSADDFALKLKDELKKVWCEDSACRLMGLTQHEFGKGCRLF